MVDFGRLLRQNPLLEQLWPVLKPRTMDRGPRTKQRLPEHTCFEKFVQSWLASYFQKRFGNRCLG